MLGEAEFVANKQVYFGSDEHLELIDLVYGTIANTALEYSKELAVEKGSSIVEGLRNLYRMCIAPNTSSGIFASTTAGCEPAYAKVWIESKQKLHNIRMTAPNINVENFKYYQNAFEIDQKRMITASGRRQKYIDMSISHSIFKALDGDTKASDILHLVIHAWKEGLKSIYYLRSKQPTNSFLDDEIKTSNGDISCVGCTN